MELTLLQRKTTYFSKRIHEIDFIRGFLIFLVIMDHTFWCFYNYGSTWHYAFPNNHAFEVLANAFGYYWNSDGRDFVRLCALFGFTFVSGVSVSFSRNSFKRSVIFMLLWGFLAIGSNLVQAFLKMGGKYFYTRLDFNIIAVVAWCTLIYSFFAKGKNRVFVIILGIGFLLWWFIIPGLYYDYPELRLLYLPPLWDPTTSGNPQADWLPLFPYLLFFFMGVLFSRIFYADKKSKVRFHPFERPLCFMGRHTLWFYFGWEIFILIVFEIIDSIIMK